MNTRRFHRTLMSAFPQDHAESIYHYRRPLVQRVSDAIFVAVLAVFAAVLAFHYLSR